MPRMGSRDLAPERLAQMVGSRRDKARLRFSLFPFSALVFIRWQIGGRLTAIPDDLCHLHDLLARPPGRHGKERVRDLADFYRVRVGIGPVRYIVYTPTAAPDAGRAHGRVEERPQVVAPGGSEPLVHVGVQIVPTVAALPEPAIVL